MSDISNNYASADSASLEAEYTTLGSSSDDVLDKSVLDGNIQTVPLAALGDITRSKSLIPAPKQENKSLAMMMDVPITLVLEVGRTNISIAQLMELRAGSFIDLRNVSVDSIDVRVNEKVIAQAEAISLQQRYGIRFGEIELPHNSGEEESNV
ncbi:MAG: hypothetical protein COA96_05015 [SAR86 cluster bacterium]|uniref:Flagellar motor switch protein FliN n=1 Tax=SAR86 cluster bacterium TaxID=2030880 RepID=A0A2A5B5T3_9GAMM|nr:MAG: hypothetical protein COA96_05015 [SAR86 cluster bacterium]